MKARLVTYKGKTQTVKEWEKETGMSADLITARLGKGWTAEETFTRPIQMHTYIKYLYKGEYYTATALARIHGGIAASTMQQRLEHMTVEEAMALPNTRPRRKKRITEERQKEIFMPKPKKIDYTQCKTCQYRSTISSGSYPGNLCCGYALVNDRCRSLISPPSPHCTVYIKGPSLVRAAALKKARRGAWG